MGNITVKRYQPTDSKTWDDFVRRSKNATFLFERAFMDYHADRFKDHSLMLFDGDKPIAILPAHESGGKLYSHLGLTYGGLAFDRKCKLKQVVFALRSILVYLAENEISTFVMKLIPSIYHKIPSDEFSYALFLAEARLLRRDSLSVIDLNSGFEISKTREQSVRRGKKNNLEIREEPDFKMFWNDILIPNLKDKHNAKPVHSAEEIQLLHERFPQQIRQFNVYQKDTIVAGATIFETDTVAHCQYISANAQKNELASLDYLFHFLIADVFRQKRFFDFGTSNEEEGKRLNEGLVFWKESFGAATVVQDFYELPTKNHCLLENVLI